MDQNSEMDESIIKGMFDQGVSLIIIIKLLSLGQVMMMIIIIILMIVIIDKSRITFQYQVL